MKKFEQLINYIFDWTDKEDFAKFISETKSEGADEVKLTTEIIDYIYDMVDCELERREKLGENYLSEYRELIDEAIKEYIEEEHEEDERYFWYFIAYRILDTLNIEY